MKFKYGFAVILGLCLLSLAFAQTEAKKKKLPLFTPFNWAETAPDGYIIQGQICNNASGIGSGPCGPVTFVVDPPNKRILFDLGSNGGKYFILNNASYISGGVPGQPNLCFQVPGFTFNQEVSGYLNVLSMPPDSSKSKVTYFGRALDVGSCTDKIAVGMNIQFISSNGVLEQFNFTQMFPFEGVGCSFVTGTITFDLNTLDFTSNRDSYFALPAGCNSSAPSWCATIYPPGNACNLSISSK